MSFLNKAKSAAKGRRPAQTEYEQWSSPAPWRTEDGVYVGPGNQVWLYRTLDLMPMKWEDSGKRAEASNQLSGLLDQIGQTSSAPVAGMRFLAANREIHIVSTTWQKLLSPPSDNPPALSDFQADAYSMTVPARALLLGVRLRANVFSKKRVSEDGLFKQLTSMARQAMADDVPDLRPFEDDKTSLLTIFDRFDAKVPTKEEFDQLESWFNQGLGQDVLIEERPDHIEVARTTPIQLSAIRKFSIPKLTAPQDQWVLDALAHPGDAPHHISIRAELEPPESTRARARMSQRRIRASMEEEQEAGDLEKVEYSQTFQLAQELENQMTGSSSPMLTKCSFIMAREVTEETETYMDYLTSMYGIEFSSLEHRQILALDETMPASAIRVNPFLQDVNIPMVASAGIQAFSKLGDDSGCYVGIVDPDGAPLFIDPLASSRHHLPPAMGVFGDPGSGKSSPVSTKVLTPTGETTMGQLRPGDRVMGVHGRPIVVKSIHPQGKRQTFRITVSDGRTVDTSDEHLLPVRDVTGPEGIFQNVTLGEVLAAGLTHGDGSPRWTLPAPSPVQHDPFNLPADPYVVGLALTASACDPATKFRMVDQQASEVLAALTDGRRVPEEFFYGSVSQRTALLQGFMDCVGGVLDSGQLFARLSHHDLAKDVQRLVWSLGGVATLPEDSTEVVFDLPAGVSPSVARSLNYETRPGVFELRITSVEPTTVDEHVCISVDDESHLYISGEYVVTHNTFFAQNFATQVVLSGLPVFFINPKAADPLTGMVDYINDSTPASATIISTLDAEKEPGAFDPFRFANDPLYAAEMANHFILSALDLPQDPLPRDMRLALGSGLRYGAEAGAQCVWEALDYIPDEGHREYLKRVIDQQSQASVVFSMGVAKKPRSRLTLDSHLTLLSFDREIGLPSKADPSQYSVSERIALAMVNLATKAALEILIANKGGVLLLDEAWTFLGQPEVLSVLDRLSREGRSLNVVPVFLTQRIKDVISRDLEGFMSRVMVLKLNEEEEARAALKICGLDPTPARLDMLRKAGPKRATDTQPARWAQGIFRDLRLQHSWVALGPTPDDAAKAWSTSPEDKQRMQQERLARQAQADAQRERELAEAPAAPAPTPRRAAHAPAALSTAEAAENLPTTRTAQAAPASATSELTRPASPAPADGTPPEPSADSQAADAQPGSFTRPQPPVSRHAAPPQVSPTEPQAESVAPEPEPTEISWAPVREDAPPARPVQAEPQQFTWAKPAAPRDEEF